MSSDTGPAYGASQALRVLNTFRPTAQTTETRMLYLRKFKECASTKEKGQVIRVMQWNVLAQGLTTSNPRKNFCKTPQSQLSWENRRYLFLLEILSYMPDIIIIQECDRFDFLETKLREFGYRGKFHERPFSPCVDVPGEEDAKPDGCAIFYHSERFHFVDVVHRALVNLMKHSTSSLAMGLKLEFIEDSTPIFVVNTHLKGGPKSEAARYEACIDLMNFIGEHKDNKSVVILGADICEEPSDRGYDHILSRYKDAYSYGLEGKHPAFTTWRVRPLGEEKYCNDVIFFDHQLLRVLRVLETPPESSISENRLPNNRCGSDHVSLVCDFQKMV